MITPDTRIEEALGIPGIVSYFFRYGFSPLVHSVTFSGTLGELLEIKRVPDPEAFINGLNAFLTELAIAIGGGPD